MLRIKKKPTWTSRNGQVELYRGDCLKEMKGINKVDMILADPPYGTTACAWDSIIPLKPLWKELKRVIKQNGAIVMTADQPFTSSLILSNIKNFKYSWTWVKENGTGFLNAKKYPLKNNEDIPVFCKKPHVYNPQFSKGKRYICRAGGTSKIYNPHRSKPVTINNGERYYPLTTIYFARDSAKSHPTQKPVALMRYLIKTYTNKGDTVLDFTMGSGTTGVACIQTDRKFIGIELDETYFNIAKKRIKKALRKGRGFGLI